MPAMSVARVMSATSDTPASTTAIPALGMAALSPTMASLGVTSSRMAGISEAIPVIIISSDMALVRTALSRTASARQDLDRTALHHMGLVEEARTGVAEEEDVREDMRPRRNPFGG